MDGGSPDEIQISYSAAIFKHFLHGLAENRSIYARDSFIAYGESDDSL